MKRSIHVLALAFAGAQLAVLLGEQYVFANIGRNYATILRRNLPAGRYEDLIDAECRWAEDW